MIANVITRPSRAPARRSGRDAGGWKGQPRAATRPPAERVGAPAVAQRGLMNERGAARWRTAREAPRQTARSPPCVVHPQTGDRDAAFDGPVAAQPRQKQDGAAGYRTHG